MNLFGTHSTTRAGSLTGALLLALLAVIAYPVEAANPVVTVKLEFEKAPKVTAKDIAYAAWPSGKKIAVSYAGVTKLGAIQKWGKAGFRTTVSMGGAGTSAAQASLKGYLGAGAGFRHPKPMGMKGGYSSMIQGNTVQETFDAISSMRLSTKKGRKRPVLGLGFGGHINPTATPMNRNFESNDGYGAAVWDSHYLYINYHGRLGVFKGRRDRKPMFGCGGFEGSDPRKVPNEMNYYRMIQARLRGALVRPQVGQLMNLMFRDYAEKDRLQLEKVLKEFGNHPLLWHVSEEDVVSYHYLKQLAKVKDVRKVGSLGLEIDIELSKELYTPFVRHPLTLRLPVDAVVKSASVQGIACTLTKRGNPKSAAAAAEDEDPFGPPKTTAADTGGKLDGMYVDVPIYDVLTKGLEVTYQPAAQNMTIPDAMDLTLTFKNASGKAMKNAVLELVASPSIKGDKDLSLTYDKAPFALAPGAEKKVTVKVKTVPGDRFGLSPVIAILSCEHNGTKRILMAGDEINIAPMLAVESAPYSATPYFKGRTSPYIVYLSNRNRWLCHRARGPLKGKLKLEMPKGMTAKPAEVAFELKKGGGTRFVFQVTNTEWSTKVDRIHPRIQLENDPNQYVSLHPGTPVLRNQQRLDYKPLDAEGLLLFASFDKGPGGFEKVVGGKKGKNGKVQVNINNYGAPYTISPGGVKGKCLGAKSGCVIDAHRNIDYMKGTICFWLRRDNAVPNDNFYFPGKAKTKGVGVNGWNNKGETIIGWNGSSTRLSQNASGISLRRYSAPDGKDGYLQLIYQGMEKQIRFCQATWAFKRLNEWRHVAMTWDMNKKLLQLYTDGTLKATAEPGAAPWLGRPWTKGAGATDFIVLSMDHGKWTGTQRDELYIYDRVLTPEQIMANLKKSKK